MFGLKEKRKNVWFERKMKKERKKEKGKEKRKDKEVEIGLFFHV